MGEKTGLRSNHSFQGRTDISKRYDGTYALWYCMSMGDLDMIPPEIVKEAIMLDMPYLNPLKWAIVATTDTREQAVEISKAIRSTGLWQWLEQGRDKSKSLLTGLELGGDFGYKEIPPAPMAIG